MDTKLAYKPGSGHFGSMVAPVAKVVGRMGDRKVYLDGETGAWTVMFPCGTVATSRNKAAIEAFLDHLDNCGSIEVD